QVRSEGVSLLLVEQNVVSSLRIADRAYVLENGEIRKEGRGADLLDDPDVKAAYLSTRSWPRRTAAQRHPASRCEVVVLGRRSRSFSIAAATCVPAEGWRWQVIERVSHWRRWRQC